MAGAQTQGVMRSEEAGYRDNLACIREIFGFEKRQKYALRGMADVYRSGLHPVLCFQ
jgi:hypothetical protein